MLLCGHNRFAYPSTIQMAWECQGSLEFNVVQTLPNLWAFLRESPHL